MHLLVVSQNVNLMSECKKNRVLLEVLMQPVQVCWCIVVLVH